MPIYMQFLDGIYPIRLLRVDENGQFLRNGRGFCIRCQPGEAGEIVYIFIFLINIILLLFMRFGQI